jgi:acetyl-CoA carboxylase carboxyltransferase component
LKQGKLLARERIALLLDVDSFDEIGQLSGAARYDADNDRLEHVQPSNFVCGVGSIDARRVYCGVDDFTQGAGHFDGAAALKQAFIERQALLQRWPMLRLLDGASGGGTVDLVLKLGRSYLPWVEGFFTMSQLVKHVACCVDGLAIDLRDY